MELSEDEIIKNIKEMIQWSDHNTYKMALQGLLDLYNKEKEKNLIFKGATIVSDLENNGIEIKMNADKLIALYLEEKEKNKDKYWEGYIQKQNESMEICKMCKYRKKVREYENQMDLDYVDENYVSKDKIRELKKFYIKDYKNRNITLIPLENLIKNINILLEEE